MSKPDAGADPSSRRFVQALLQSEPFRGAGPARVIETHISWVILAGEYAYKIKKPVNLGFVDFSTLEKRRAACEEELRLNRRLAPDVYLDVAYIAGTRQKPLLGGPGAPIEYVVRMRRFPAGAVLGEEPLTPITPAEIERLATDIAEFHRSLPAALDRPWGTAESVWAPIDESLRQIAALPGEARTRDLLPAIRNFCSTRFEASRGRLEHRRAQGFIRECHGDLHLGNLVRLADRIVPFDALEFDPALRWIDVLSEVAFLVMDLEIHQRRDLAFRFLNRYLAVTGDYEGLAVLPLYLAYRAIVRAKVRILSPGPTAPEQQAMLQRLLAYAADPLAGHRPVMLLMCGVSGSGKSFLATRIATQLGALHLRSDIERKRLAGLPEMARTTSALSAGIYSPEISRMTYKRLAALADIVLSAGFPVVVDATSLRPEDRRPFAGIAHALGYPSAIVHTTAPTPVLMQRLTARSLEGRDVSEADEHVARMQLRRLRPPGQGEADTVMCVDTSRTIDLEPLFGQIAP